MLITESQMSVGRQTNVLGLLDNMSYLTEAESVYAPAMVPVVESQAYQAHLIRLEDMMSFAESNGIEDLGYALTLVCEASQIDPSTVAFTVQEASIIADPEIASLTSSIMNEGVRIAAVPVSDNDPAGQLCNIAVNNLIETCNDSLFNYVTEGVAELDDEALNAMGGGNMSDMSDDDLKGAANSDASSAGHKVDGIIAKAKKYANKGRDFIAKYIAKLHDWAKKINEQMHNVPSDKRTLWESIKKKITGAIAWLTAKMSSIAHNKMMYDRKNPSYWDKGEAKKN